MWNAEVYFRPLIIILNRSVRRWSSQLLCVCHNVDRGEAILHPIENQKQHCCVHDIQNDKIKQLVSLGSLGDVTDVFALLCDWTLTNAQKYLTKPLKMYLYYPCILEQCYLLVLGSFSSSSCFRKQQFVDGRTSLVIADLISALSLKFGLLYRLALKERRSCTIATIANRNTIIQH